MTTVSKRSVSTDPLASIRSWEPVSTPVCYYGTDRQLRTADGEARVMMRSDSQKMIGVVGAIHQFVTHESICDLFDMLVERGVLSGLRCGEFRGGRRIWVQGENTNKKFEIMPGHELKHKMALIDSYDGSTSLALVDTATNIVCQNTFMKAYKSKIGQRLRHTTNIKKYFEDIVAAIAESASLMEKTTATLREMSVKSADHSDFVAMLDRFFPLPSKDDGSTIRKFENVAERRNRVAWAYEYGPGAVPGTRYGMYQAMTYWLTHEVGSDSSRFESNLLGTARKTNEKVLSYLMN